MMSVIFSMVSLFLLFLLLIRFAIYFPPDKKGNVRFPMMSGLVFKDASWIEPLSYRFLSQNEIRSIGTILATEIHIHSNETSVQKSEKISSYLLRTLRDKRGEFTYVPYTNAYAMWVDVMAGNKSVACYDFALLYAMISNIAGVSTRLVYLGPPFQVPYHTIDESYSEEEKKWFIVDLQYSLLHARDDRGVLLTTQEYKNAIQSHEIAKTRLTVGRDGQIKEMNMQDFFHLNPGLLGYFGTNSATSYRIFSKEDGQHIRQWSITWPGI